jgi:hypothetical protein
MNVTGEIFDDLPECFEVFISHRSTWPHRELSDALKAKLEKRNIRYFLDEKSLHAGDAFTARIIESIRRSRLVVVFFPKEMSPWLHFEAACAFFDRKLLPVAVDGGVVPPPYDRIHYESLTASIDNDGLERVTREIESRVRGEGHATEIYRWINRLFFRGFNIIFAVSFALLALRLGAGDLVDHLHAIVGAVMLGGQFFLSIGFATIAASPSFEERRFGFNTIEWLLIVWIALAVIQPFLGMWLVVYRLEAQPPPWILTAIIFYLLGMLFTIAGYVIAKGARELDGGQAGPRSIALRDLLANISFLVGFVAMVAVMDVMLANSRG